MSRRPTPTTAAGSVRPIALDGLADPDAHAAATRGPAELALFASFLDRHGYDPGLAEATGLAERLARHVWVPMVVACTDDATDRLGPWATLVGHVARQSLAERTHDTYRSAWRQVVFWATVAGVDPLDASVDDVIAFLVWAACATDGDDLLVDADGELLAGSLRPRTLGTTLSAIDRVRRVLGQDPVSLLPAVVDLKRGLARRFSLTIEGKAPLGIDLITEILAAIDREDDTSLRDRAVLGLWAAGVSPSTIARLTWTDLVAGDDAVVVAPLGARAEPAVVSDSSAVAAIEAWRARSGDGPVTAVPGPPVDQTTVAADDDDEELPDLFARSVATLTQTTETTRDPGSALTRPGVVKAIRRRLVAVDATVPSGNACPAPDDTDPAHIAAAIAAPTVVRSLAGTRDAALLVIAWYTALRRVNLAQATWSDVDLQPHRVRWRPGPTKTNPSADPAISAEWLTLPASPDPDRIPCPVAALGAWRNAVASLIGADPCTTTPDAPVLFPINRHGQPLVLDALGDRRWLTSDAAAPVELLPMSGDAICEVVQRRVAQIGLDAGRYGAHSTRAGFVTDAYAAGLDHTAIREVTGHRRDASIDAYIRQDPARADNPLARLQRGHRASKRAT